MGLLDYSLLLAVEKLEGTPRWETGKFSKLQSADSLYTAKISSLESANDKIQCKETVFSSITTGTPSSLKRSRHCFLSTCGNYAYHIAIIDYLTEFNLAKKIESFFKTDIKGNRRELVSAVSPDLYAQRFIKFMYKEVIVNERKKEESDIVLDSQELKDALFNKIYIEFQDEEEGMLV